MAGVVTFSLAEEPSRPDLEEPGGSAEREMVNLVGVGEASH